MSYNEYNNIDSTLRSLANKNNFIQNEIESINESLNELKFLIIKNIKRMEEFSNTQSDDLLTDKEACKLLKRSRTTLYKWRKTGLLPYKEVMGAIYYSRTEILKFLD